MHDFKVFTLKPTGFGLPRQVDQAEDAIHRRADFMAHIGQESGLGCLSLFGLFQHALGGARKCNDAGQAQQDGRREQDGGREFDGGF